VKAPPAVIAAPAGAPAPSENVSVLAGRSASVAVAVKRAGSYARELVDRLVADRCQHRILVHLVDRDVDRLGIREGAVGDPDRDRIDARTLRFGRRPREGAARRDRRPAGAPASSVNVSGSLSASVAWP
jgi:hypothetical protein